MTLTQDDLDVLAHVVVDPQGWGTHALATVGENAVLAKIQKYHAQYTSEKSVLGYKNAAVRRAEEDDKQTQAAEAAVQNRQSNGDKATGKLIEAYQAQAIQIQNLLQRIVVLETR